MFILSLCLPNLTVSSHGALFVLQLGLLDASVVCESNLLISCRLLVTSHDILSKCGKSMSGIPCSAVPSHDNTENLYLVILSLYLNSTNTCLIVQYQIDYIF